MRICITGATGFIGAALTKKLSACNHEIITLGRQAPTRIINSSSWIKFDLENPSFHLGDIGSPDALIHVAGRAHILKETSSNPIDEFRRINVEATVKLAKAAAHAGIKRLIFISTVGVHGVNCDTITEFSPIDPQGAYARSKHEAEILLRQVAVEESLDLTIIRPALVSGFGAPGNLYRLAQLISVGIPLIAPNRENARSFVALNNLIDLLRICLENPAAIGQTFLAAESQWPSTCQVMRWIADGMRKRVRILRVSDILYRAVARVSDRLDLYEKLYGDLRVDASKARNVLNWSPIETLEDSLKEVGRGYLFR